MTVFKQKITKNANSIVLVQKTVGIVQELKDQLLHAQHNVVILKSFLLKKHVMTVTNLIMTNATHYVLAM